jgi:hypothetical protein
MQTADEPTPLPRKKPSAFWWIGSICFLLIALFLFQLFGPNPRIVVSPQTTYITKPLGRDGLPDYEQYVLQLYRDGVTPENNAAEILWPALWPGELDPPQYAAVAAELGLSQIPSQADAVSLPYNKPTIARLIAWLHLQKEAAAASKQPAGQSPEAYVERLAQLEKKWTKDDPLNDTAEEVIDRAMHHPWTSEQIPPLARWVAENQKPLDRMVEASLRSRCFFPSPSLLNGESESLVAMLLPGVQSSRSAGQTLATRAMLHLGEGRHAAAWKDLYAVHRLGHLTAEGGKTIVEQLVGISITNIAYDGTLALLNDETLPLETAEQIERELAALGYFDGIVDCIDKSERLSFLDTAIRGARDGDVSVFADVGAASGQQVSYLSHMRVNWNTVLVRGNEFYDRMAAAARTANHQQRNQALAKIESDLDALSSELNRPGTLVESVINPVRRSDAVASMMIAVFLPATTTALASEDQANTRLDLERLAAALTVYRAKNHHYPAKLDELVPGVIAKLPVDLYHGKPFIYKRFDNGYLLYTAGENGQDDGGSSLQLGIFEGNAIDDLDQSQKEATQEKIPSGADDLSIRLPRPLFKMPVITSPSVEPEER